MHLKIGALMPLRCIGERCSKRLQGVLTAANKVKCYLEAVVTLSLSKWN